MNKQELQRIFHQNETIYIYGAGVVAYGIYKAIQELFFITPKQFLVTQEDGQLHWIENIPVVGIERAKIEELKYLILIAVPEEYHNEIEYKLKELKIVNYLKLDALMEYILMGSFLKQVKELKLIEDYQVANKINHFTYCQIYMAVSHRDKQLYGIYEEESWIKKVQAGAALTKERIAETTDDGSDSLSVKNALYGELTVTYYAWKHNVHAITGLFHYRRVLEVTKEQLSLLWDGTVDVILPLPFVCLSSATGQYGRYILPEDVSVMMEVLREKEPEHFEEIVDILKTPYLYNYNMLIARKEVFNNYCSWLFPILEEITERCENVKRNRRSRYIGRIGEVLTSIYFMRNERNLHIVHAKKIWRV